VRIPRPTYDAELVEAIEEHLNQEQLTSPSHADYIGGGLKVTHYLGEDTKLYARPIIQIMNDNGAALTTTTTTYRRPCPHCYDFSRTWKCPDHHELPWNTETGTWAIPHQADDDQCACIDCRQNRTGWPGRSVRCGHDCPICTAVCGPSDPTPNTLEVSGETIQGSFTSFSINIDPPR
jgi:hypothetical protein